MNLDAEITKTLESAAFPLLAREIRAEIMARTGHVVRLDTVVNRLRVRTKMLGDCTVDVAGGYELRPAED